MERFDVFRGAEAIGKDPRALMQPQFRVLVSICNLVRFTHEDPLEHFGHITQIECVVELSWDGKHRVANLLVHVNRSLDGNTRLKLVAGSLSAEKPSQDRLEN